MRWFSWMAGGLLATLACAGCYESRLSSSAPRGGGGLLDGSLDGGSLGGGSLDGAAVVTSDGARSDAPPLEAGRPDGGALDCTAPIPDYTGPRCRPATLQCLEACTDVACGACYDADPECLLCIYQSIAQCANALGCRDEWEAFACCADRSGTCGDLELDTLLFECGGACPAESEAWGECLTDTLSRGECNDAPGASCLP